MEEAGEDRESTAVLAVVPLGQLAPPETLEAGRCAPVALRLPSNTFQVPPALFCGGRAGGRGLPAPWLPWELQDSHGWILVLVPWRRGDPGPLALPLPPLLPKAGHRTGPGTPEWAQAAG